MGQTYDVNLRVRFKDEQGARKALLAKIGRANEEKVLYGERGLRAMGFDLDNDIWDLMSVFFCGWGQRLKETANKDWLYSGFDASYGWERVMMEAFEEIAPYLEEGSEIKIYPDCGPDHGVVNNGEVNWEKS